MPAYRSGLVVLGSSLLLGCADPGTPGAVTTGLSGAATTGGGVFDTEIDPTAVIPEPDSGTSRGEPPDPGTTTPIDDTTGGTTSSSSSGTTTSTDETTSEGSSSGGGQACHPMLAEVLYDVTGADDQREWVRLFNPCMGAIDLSGYGLGWGGPSYIHGTTDLQGMIAPGDCVTIGGPLSDATNGSPVFDQAVDLQPDLENSGLTGDGVALFSVPAGNIGAATLPVDAVIYGPNNDNGLLDEEGPSPLPNVGDAPPGESLQRTGPVIWGMGPPVPGLCPPF